MIHIIKVLAAVAGMMCAWGGFQAWACTSMIVSAKASASGRPLLWKHRDTDTEHNFVERVGARRAGEHAYVALFNGGDSLLREAWMGMNDAGFAIMNTASYNLAPDTARIKDREGEVMARALAVCRSVDDFRNLLDTLPKPLGVQANFGVIDSEGNGAYFETDDYNYTPFYLKDAPDGVLVRTNFSFTGNDTDGMGYIRFDSANRILADEIREGKLTPESFTEKASRSFYNSRLDKDFMLMDDWHFVVDQDFIPRHSSSASIVIEGRKPGNAENDAVMWTVIGYPPVSHVQAVTVEEIPEGLRPHGKEWRSPDCDAAIEREGKAFPVKRGSGQRYVSLDYLRGEMPVQRELSEKAYREYRAKNNKKY